MTKNKRIQKLDRRHTGHGVFKYYITPLGNTNDWSTRYNILQEWREWCWQTWGPGTERDHAMRSRTTKDWPWAWDIEHYHCRLYLRGDEELAWFGLKFQ